MPHDAAVCAATLGEEVGVLMVPPASFVMPRTPPVRITRRPYVACVNDRGAPGDGGTRAIAGPGGVASTRTPPPVCGATHMQGYTSDILTLHHLRAI